MCETDWRVRIPIVTPSVLGTVSSVRGEMMNVWMWSSRLVECEALSQQAPGVV